MAAKNQEQTQNPTSFIEVLAVILAQEMEIQVRRTSKEGVGMKMDKCYKKRRGINTKGDDGIRDLNISECYHTLYIGLQHAVPLIVKSSCYFSGLKWVNATQHSQAQTDILQVYTHIFGSS